MEVYRFLIMKPVGRSDGTFFFRLPGGMHVLEERRPCDKRGTALFTERQ